MCVSLGWRGWAGDAAPASRSCSPPQRPPTLPSTELSPPVGLLYSLGVLASVQGGPGWLQRQEGQGLRPTRPSPILPSLPSHRIPGSLERAVSSRQPACLCSALPATHSSSHFYFSPENLLQAFLNLSFLICKMGSEHPPEVASDSPERAGPWRSKSRGTENPKSCVLCISSYHQSGTETSGPQLDLHAIPPEPPPLFPECC